MEKYKYTKIFASLIGALIIIASLGFVSLFLIGTLLAAGSDSSSFENIYFIILLSILIILGIITFSTPFKLKNHTLKKYYMIFCWVMGSCCLIAFFLSMGAIGTIFEYLILMISISYFLLGLFVKNEK